MTTDFLEELNPRQREVAEHGVGPSPGGPLLVVAGAGSGKTKALCARVVNLLLKGVPADRILLLTFTRRAAAEMSRRAERAAAGAGMTAGMLAWAGTFHAIGARLLRLWAGAIGLDPAFTILDRADAEDLLDIARADLGLAAGNARFPRKATCLSIYSACVNAQVPLPDILEKSYPWCAEAEGALKSLFGAYVAAKQRQNLLDYDDLLLWWARMMEEADIASAVGAMFDHILVDEYQDTNALQAAILLAMKPDGAGVMAVGDDAQSIYSFRAATVRNILDFPRQFGRPADLVTLEQNYRSTQPILDACNALIAHAEEGHAKQLFTERTGGAKPRLLAVADERAQVAEVVALLLANLEEGLSLRDQAVLFRTSSHAAMLEMELTRRRIPYRKFGGLKFLEAAHVKDLVAILRLAENPRDQTAGLRVLKLMAGVGASTAMKALALVAESGRLDALAEAKVPPAARPAWSGLVQLYGDLAGQAQWTGQIGLVRAWYDPILAERYDDVATRLSDLEQLDLLAAGQGSRRQFLTELALDPPDAAGGESGVPFLEEDWLTLSTIHSAKGQEWRSVFLLNIVDGCIPSDLATGSRAEIEEERRLLYVAMTRARDQLTLVHPLRFHVRGQAQFGDRHIFAPRSRFIPPSDLIHYDLAGGRPVAAGTPGPNASVARVDLGRKMRDMWG